MRLKVRISYMSKLRTFFFFPQRKADGTNKRPDVIYLPLSMQKKKKIPHKLKLRARTQEYIKSTKKDGF